MNVTPILRPKALPIARNMPIAVGVVHFIGIGGIGMSGIAEILHTLGYQVQGTDIAESANIERLRTLGIAVSVGHAASNLKEASVVVISSAVKPDNPEVVAARTQRIPVVRRAEMLAELMRLKMAIAVAGTHGKTTTTSLMAALFDAAKLKPTVINGGIINAYGTNARMGSGEWIVAEADESDGTFIRLPATIAVVTNIDPEHLDHFGTFDNLRAAFQQFIENVPFYGFAVLCVDHPEVQTLMGKVRDRRVISYGVSPQADVRAINIRREAGGQRFDIETEDTCIRDVFLPMHGGHNVLNALAVAAVARELTISGEVLKEAFCQFGGVKRRFTRTGTAGGITVIDDYGHHPVEIAATLRAARESLTGSDGRVIAVVQPHRYTRLRDLFSQFCTCFNDADTVIVADVYSAGEEPIAGISRDTLVEGLLDAGHRHALTLSSPENLAQLLLTHAGNGDLVVCLGAGSITKWANALPQEMESLMNVRRKA